MNFISTFDELNKLYEEAPKVVSKKADDLCAVMLDGQQKYTGTKEECENWLKDKTGPLASRFKIVQGADVPVIEALTEAAEDEEIEIVDDEVAVEEIPAEEPVVEEDPRQVICECDKCGALVLKDEADIVVDEETDLVNVEEECQFCEEAKGYKIIGVVAPYEVTEEEPVEDEEIFEEAVEVAGDATYKNYIPAFKKIAEAVDGKFDFMGNLVVDSDRIIMTINRDINKNELKQVLDAMSATQTCKENRWEAVYTGMKADKNVIIQFEPKR